MEDEKIFNKFGIPLGVLCEFQEGVMFSQDGKFWLDIEDIEKILFEMGEREGNYESDSLSTGISSGNR